MQSPPCCFDPRIGSEFGSETLACFMILYKKPFSQLRHLTSTFRKTAYHNFRFADILRRYASCEKGIFAEMLYYRVCVVFVFSLLVRFRLLQFKKKNWFLICTCVVNFFLTKPPKFCSLHCK